MRMNFKRERVRPAIAIPEGFIMIQDTREQKPLFTPADWVIEKGLPVGDYSILGFEKIITIERKSLPDLYGTLGKGRKRFEKELLKMVEYEWAGLLIEGPESNMMKEQDYSSMTPNQIYHAVSSIESRGIHVYYADKVGYARDWVLSRLTRFYTHARRV